MIESIQQTDILEGLKRGHHVFIDVPFEGGEAALEYHSNNGQGYGLLAYLQEEHPTLTIEGIPQHKRYDGIWVNCRPHLGDMFDWYDETEDVTWHFVYTHTVEGGHLAEELWDYELITTKLDSWWEENEELIPMHGVHAVMFGSGVHHAKVGESRAKPVLMLSLQANSEVPFDIRYA